MPFVPTRFCDTSVVRVNILGAALTCGALALAGLVASASERPTVEYVDTMKTLDAVALGLSHAVDAWDHEAMNQHVLRARPALNIVLKYWRDRGVDETDDAITAVRAAVRAVSEISVAVHLMSISPNPVAVEGAQIALENLKSACTTCHAAHREEHPDGSFRIK